MFSVPQVVNLPIFVVQATNGFIIVFRTSLGCLMQKNHTKIDTEEMQTKHRGLSYVSSFV